MTYKMNAEYQKVLTEMIRECWHIATWKPANTETPSGYWECSCGKRTSGIPSCKNRTFTTDPEMMKVFRWLVDNGKWEDFWIYASGYGNSSFNPHEFTAWLFCDSERFNVLVAMSKLEGVI
jgi:hypothetical protein